MNDIEDDKETRHFAALIGRVGALLGAIEHDTTARTRLVELLADPGAASLRTAVSRSYAVLHTLLDDVQTRIDEAAHGEQS